MRLKEKVAIVTGAASGIGKATARLFASKGAKVVLADCQVAPGEEAARAIRSEGGEATFVHADVTVSGEAQGMVRFALETYGRLDVLMNNAGIELYRPLVETGEEEWDQVLAVNVKGIYLCSKYAIPRMAEAGGGSIINIASVAGLVGFSGLSAYNASKGAVVVLTKNMALECAPQRIRVNCICPGVIQTPMVDRLCEAMGDYETQQREFLRLHPLGRLGTPQDIAYAALYLASEESSFVTGAALVVDGGFTAQ